MSAASLKPFGADGIFHAHTGDEAIRRIAVRGAGVTVFAQAIVLAVQVVSTVVLARLLVPKDFGTVAMVTTFSLLLVGFGLNGFTEVVIQRDRLKQSLASNLFWITVSAGLLFTVGFAAAGALMAWFYKDPAVVPVAEGISLTILLSSTSVLHLALLKRAMRFSSISVNDIVARAFSVMVAIVLACFGWGVWSLVLAAIAQALSVSIGAWFLCRWWPTFPQYSEETGSAVRDAMRLYGRFGFNYLTRNTDNLLVGWRCGPAALGFYKKAYDLFLLSASQLVSPLTTVAISALSRLDQLSDEYKRSFLNAVAIMAFVGMGLGGDLTLVGKDVIRILLGPGWGVAGQIFTFFGPGIGVMLLYGTHGWIHLSIGTAGRYLRWVIVEFSVTGLLFLAGLRWGPVGIAVAWSVSFWLLLLPAFWYAGKPIGLSVLPVVAAIWKYVIASVVAGVACAAVISTIPVLVEAAQFQWVATRLVVTSLLFSLFYLAAVVLLHGGIAPLRQFINVLQAMTTQKPVLSASVPSESEAKEGLLCRV